MSPRSILIGVCTFQRPSLEQTLLALAALTIPPDTNVRIAVADNDETPSAEPLVRRVAARTGRAIEHLHVPARNISLARNALLNAAESAGGDVGPALLAFLDDDEWVEPDWLTNILSALDAASADAAFGPVRGIYAENAPNWMRQGAFHDTKPELDREGRVRNGYTCNVLLDLATPAFRGRRFDLTLGRSGGEDTTYFDGARRAGAVLVPAPLAVASEHVPADRAAAVWLARRRFRMGQTHATLIGSRAGTARRLRLAAVAGAKSAVCLALAAAQAPSAPRRNRALLRCCLHAGAASGLLGARTLVLYGGSEAVVPQHSRDVGSVPADPAA